MYEPMDVETIAVFLGTQVLERRVLLLTEMFLHWETFQAYKHKNPTVLCRYWSFPPEAKLYETSPRRELDFAKNIFNCQISSKRRTIECTFALL